MLFNSFAFLLFFSLLMLISFSSPSSWTKTIVLIASIIFYSYWYPPYLILLLISVSLNYFCSIAIENKRFNNGITNVQLGPDFKPSTNIGFEYVLISSILNLALLFSFKYTHFFCEILGLRYLENIHWALPLGISFFTFHGMACVIDVYRGQSEAKRNFWDYLLFTCFFPQLIAGPILRLHLHWDKVLGLQKPDLSSFNSGLYLIFWGLLKKVVIADNLAALVEQYFNNPQSLNGALALLGAYAFAVQIYCDFSGYIDTALGIAKIFRVELPDNFNFPYLAKSITEFWHRWHITLSKWLRDFLYIPMGGNRHNHLITYRNLLITMILGGLWHGANWTFMIWGFLHGLYLSIEKAFGKTDLLKFSWLKHLISFHAICFAWIFFRAKDLQQALAYCKSLIKPSSGLIFDDLALQAISLIIIAGVLHLANYRFTIKNSISQWQLQYRLAFLLFAIAAMIIFGVKQEVRFIYFDF